MSLRRQLRTVPFPFRKSWSFQNGRSRSVSRISTSKNLETINVQPIEDGLIIQSLRTEARTYLAKAVDDPRESRMEDYLVRYLIERNEIDYDAHADLLYKLAGQIVARLRSYLEADEEVESALLRHGRQLAEFVFAQMMQHYRETPLAEEDYEVRVTRGFTLLRSQPMNIAQGQKVREFPPTSHAGI